MVGAAGVTLYIMDSARDAPTRAVIDYYRSVGLTKYTLYRRKAIRCTNCVW